jgi:hypothetical protein
MIRIDARFDELVTLTVGPARHELLALAAKRVRLARRAEDYGGRGRHVVDREITEQRLAPEGQEQRRRSEQPAGTQAGQA